LSPGPRLHLHWVSATEGQQFAGYVTELRVLLGDLGPLDHDGRDQIMKNLKPKYKLPIEVKYLWEMVADALIMDE
jgi:hypothetical protein